MRFSQRLRTTYLVLCRLPGLTLLMIGLFTVAYFIATCFLASRKPFWTDELHTYNIASFATLREVWYALSEGPDAMPPLIHLAAHFVGSALGFSHVTMRLPSMVGFWLMCVCIFLFLSRRICPMLAAVGMLFPVTAPTVYSYAYEARGYGMLVGFCGAAVVCWDLAHDARWRRFALVGLPVFLAAAIASHLYAVLVTVPLALAELARTRERRRVDWLMWMGFLAAGLVFLPLAPLLPYVRSTGKMVAATSSGVGLSTLMQVWLPYLSTSATSFGLLAFICFCRGKDWAVNDSPSPTTARQQSQPIDCTLIIGLMALPIIGWLFGNVLTGVLPFRYVLPTVIGFSLCIPLLCRAAIKHRPEVALLLAGWIAVTAAGSILSCKLTMVETTDIASGRGCFYLLQRGGELPQNELPIVVSDIYVFMELFYYAPEPLRQRLVHITDYNEWVKTTAYRSARVYGQRMEPLDQFIRSNRSFYLYDCSKEGRSNPLMARLVVEGASLHDSGLLETRNIDPRPGYLYQVSFANGPVQRDVR